MPTFEYHAGRLSLRGGAPLTEIALEAFRAGARPEAGGFALVLPNDARLEEVAGRLQGFAAVIIEFPTFRDGRAYSQARLLRERHGWRGRIVARGQVLRDQALFMLRAGVDAFEIPEDAVPGFEAAFVEFSAFYQPAADAAQPVWRARLARAAAA